MPIPSHISENDRIFAKSLISNFYFVDNKPDRYKNFCINFEIENLENFVLNYHFVECYKNILRVTEYNLKKNYRI